MDSHVKHPVKEIDPNQNYHGHLKEKVPLNKEVDKGFLNFHANHMNPGSDDNAQQKASRLLAMKRRMKAAY